MRRLLIPRRKLLLGVGTAICAPAILRAQVPLTGAGLGSPTIAVWTPAQLTNLVGWWEADFAGNTNPGGTSTTSVVDRAGNGNTLANSNTVPFTSTSSYNSKPAWNFNGATNNAALITGTTGTVALPATGAISGYVVGISTVNSGNLGAISIGVGTSPDWNNGTHSADLIDVELTGGGSFGGATAGGNPLSSALMTANNKYRIGMVINGTNSLIYLNTVAGTNTSIGATALSMTTPTNIGIGNRWAGSGSGFFTGSAWNGPILGGLVASAAWSAADIANIDNYFTVTKGWGT